MPGRACSPGRRPGRTIGMVAVLLLTSACGPDQIDRQGAPDGSTTATTASGGPTPADGASTTDGTSTTDRPTTDGPATTRPARPNGPTTAAPTTTRLVRPAGPADPEGRYLEAVFATGEIVVERAIPYATAPDGGELRLDLHHATDDPAARRPVVVLVHGGGFVSGQRTALDDYARELARRGFVVAAVDYRLSRDVGSDWQGAAVRAAAALAVADVQAAVAWLRRSAEEWGLDPTRISLLGYSAGAMAAIEAGLHPTGPDDAVAAVVSIAGTVVQPELLAAPGAPLLLLHGDADRSVGWDLAEGTCTRAEEVGVACTLETFPGVGHDIVSSQRGAVLDATASFLADVLALPRP